MNLKSLFNASNNLNKMYRTLEQQTELILPLSLYGYLTSLPLLTVVTSEPDP